MERNNNVSLASNIVLHIEESSGRTDGFRKKWWFGLLCITGLSGLASGITGLVLSFLTMLEVLTSTRNLGFVVSMLIVSSLGLLLCAAHAMDRIDEIEKAGK